MDVKRTGCRERDMSVSLREIWYHAVLEKRITYSCYNWFSDLNYHALRRLSSCQRVALFSIIRGYRTVSTSALCTISGVPSIHIFLKQQMKKYKLLKEDGEMLIDDQAIAKTDIMRNYNTMEFPRYNNLRNSFFIPPVVDLVPELPVIYTDG